MIKHVNLDDVWGTEHTEYINHLIYKTPLTRPAEEIRKIVDKPYLEQKESHIFSVTSSNLEDDNDLEEGEEEEDYVFGEQDANHQSDEFDHITKTIEIEKQTRATQQNNNQTIRATRQHGKQAIQQHGNQVSQQPNNRVSQQINEQIEMNFGRSRETVHKFSISRWLNQHRDTIIIAMILLIILTQVILVKSMSKLYKRTNKLYKRFH